MLATTRALRSGGDAASGGSSGGGAASGGGDGGASGGGGCPNVDVRYSRVDPNVYLVVDGSCSMSLDYGSGEPLSNCYDNPNSRWTALRQALLDPGDGVVTNLQGVVRFGLYIFGSAGSCPFPGETLSPALDQANAIDAIVSLQPTMQELIDGGRVVRARDGTPCQRREA